MIVAESDGASILVVAIGLDYGMAIADGSIPVPEASFCPDENVYLVDVVGLIILAFGMAIEACAVEGDEAIVG